MDPQRTYTETLQELSQLDFGPDAANATHLDTKTNTVKVHLYTFVNWYDISIADKQGTLTLTCQASSRKPRPGHKRGKCRQLFQSALDEDGCAWDELWRTIVSYEFVDATKSTKEVLEHRR